MRLSSFPSTQRCCVVNIMHSCKMETGVPRHPAFQLLSPEGRMPPNSDYRSGNSAFILIHEVFTPGNCTQFEATLRIAPLICLCAYKRQHATLPIGFPLRISCGVIGVFSSPTFLDIFAYRLLKAGFNVHPYGRTIFSLIFGLPEQSALISA